MQTVEETIEEIKLRLGLKPHPVEGGFFVETYRSAEEIPSESLPSRYGGSRSFGTAIYYLITPDTFSALHRLPTDEIFHFYLGDPVEMLQLHPDGSGRTVQLGPEIERDQKPQVIVPQGVWQGSRLVAGGRFALLGCTMAPGFDFADYEAGNRTGLIARYPTFSEWIVA